MLTDTTHTESKEFVLHQSESDEADLAAHLAELFAGRGKTFFYPNGAFDWEPLFRFSHRCNLFVYADARFTEARFDQAFKSIRNRQTRAGSGLESLQVGDPPYADALEQIPLSIAQDGLGWLWEGTRPVSPWITAKLIGRNIGLLKRKIWLVYVGASPLMVYEQLFARRGLAPSILSLRLLADVDTPAEAAATHFQRNAAWVNAAHWNGPLAQVIRETKAPLPDMLVGDCPSFGWPHQLVRQALDGWIADEDPQAQHPCVYTQSGGQWPDVQAHQNQAGRRVVVTQKPLNPESAKHVDAVVLAPALYLRYQWPSNLTVVLNEMPNQPPPVDQRVLVRAIKGKPLADCLQLLEQVAMERKLKRIAVQEIGFEDEAEYLREWRRSNSVINELTLHTQSDGRFLDFAPFASKSD